MNPRLDCFFTGSPFGIDQSSKATPGVVGTQEEKRGGSGWKWFLIFLAVSLDSHRAASS